MIDDLQSALKAAGASAREVFVLAGVAYILTGGDPGWKGTAGDGRGAWGVSQKWYPGTPADLAGQAKQALTIYRNRGLAAASELLALTALAWWYPTGIASRSVKALIASKSAEYARRVKTGNTQAGVGWGWVLVVAVVVGLLWKGGKL